jgi:2-polyprenyl-6-methoxyphenol hydroxylase-like FAD-dependent oxidoreductase
MRKTNVLISGASIGGPTLAHGLNRYGFDVTVVERAAGPRPGGQAVDVRCPALEVAGRMGLLARIREKSTDLRGMSVVDEAGRELLATTERTASGGELDSPDVEILRDDLAEILVAGGGAGGATLPCGPRRTISAWTAGRWSARCGTRTSGAPW